MNIHTKKTKEMLVYFGKSPGNSNKGLPKLTIHDNRTNPSNKYELYLDLTYVCWPMYVGDRMCLMYVKQSS
jgi:hypothetical protein